VPCDSFKTKLPKRIFRRNSIQRLSTSPVFHQRVFHRYSPPTPPDLDLDSSGFCNDFKLPGYFSELVRRHREQKDPRYFYLQFLPLFYSPSFWFPTPPFDRSTFRYQFYDRIASRIAVRSEQLCACYYFCLPRLGGCEVCKSSSIGSWDFFFPDRTSGRKTTPLGKIDFKSVI
jgi:hypothetical protein